jgi:YfiH family protein
MPDPAFSPASASTGFELTRESVVRCPGLGVPHAFSTRQGGVSAGPYASLNLALASGDAREHALENRRIFAERAGFGAFPRTAHQVHGAVVNVATSQPFPEGTQGDIVITNEKGLAVGVFVADCVPVLLHAPDVGAVAAVHAGWRGTALGASRVAVEALQTTYGADPRRMVAAIGPSIKGCCYQVGSEVADAMQALPDPAACLAADGDRWKLDVQEANRQQLEAAGLLAAQVHVSGLCTHCREDLFFSYRRDGAQSGRLIGAIALPA